MAVEAGNPAVFLAEQARKRVIPGASWFVCRGQETISAGAVGWASLVPHRRKALASTVYDLASLTKPLVTATLAVLLAREDVVSLDEPAGERLEELHGSPWEQVTLLTLLTHEARLPAWEPLYLHGSDLPAYLRRVAALRPLPDAGVVYSDLGYLLAGALLERAARAPLDRLFRRWVTGPLSRLAGAGADPVRFRPPLAWRGRVAPTEADDRIERALVAGTYGFKAVAGYDGWRRGVVRGEVHDRNAAVLGGVAGHAGLFGTAAGVAFLARQFLPGSELFDLDELGLFVTPRTSPLGDLRTIGFQVPQGADAVTAAALSSRTFGHTGFTGTSLFIDPGDATICVLLTNRIHPGPGTTHMLALRRGFHQAAARILAR